jgi:small subunit ribosomal protein S5
MLHRTARIVSKDLTSTSIRSISCLILSATQSSQYIHQFSTNAKTSKTAKSSEPNSSTQTTDRLLSKHSYRNTIPNLPELQNASKDFMRSTKKPWAKNSNLVPFKYDPMNDKVDTKDPLVNNVDPYYIHSDERLNAIEKKYSFVDWNRFADRIHQHDIHFFDHDVKLVDEYFNTEVPRDKTIQFQKELRKSGSSDNDFLFIDKKLPYSFIVDNGTTVKVGPRGKKRTSWCLVCQGDRQGTAGFGIGYGDDSMQALAAARLNVLKNIMYVPLFESRTILEPVIGRFGTCRVTMMPQPRGSGIKAGPLQYEVFRLFGIYDMTAKVWGTALPRHQFFACWHALSNQKTVREVSIEKGVIAWKRFERGTMLPRHPTRAQLQQRADLIADTLTEASTVIEQKVADMSAAQPGGLGKKDTDLLLKRQLYIDTVAKLMADGVNLGEYEKTEDGKKLLDMLKEDYAKPSDDIYWKDFTYPPTYIPAFPHPGIIMPTPVPQRHGTIPQSAGIGSSNPLFTKKS